MFDAGGKFLLKEPRKKPARGTLLEYIDRLMDCNLAFEKWKQMTKCKEGCTHGCTDKSGTYKPLNMQDVCFWRTQHADRIAQEGALIKGQWLLDVVNASVIAEDAAKQMFKVAFRAEGEQKGPFLLCRECFAAMTEVKHKPQLLCWIHVHNTRPQHVHNTSTTSVHNTRPQHASAPRVHNTRPQLVHNTRPQHVHNTRPQLVHNTRPQHVPNASEMLRKRSDMRSAHGVISWEPWSQRTLFW